MNQPLLQRLRQRSPLFFIFVTVFVDVIGYGIVIPLLPFYVQALGADATTVGLLGSLYALMQFGAGPLIGSLSDRYGRRPVLLVCLAGTMLAYLLLGLADTLWLLAAAIVLDGITGGNMATAQAYVADSTAPEQRARGLGLIGAAFGLGVMAGPALGGLLSLHSLSAPAFAAAAIAAANLVFGLFALPESLPPERRTLTGGPRLNPLAPLAAGLRPPQLRGLLLAIFLLNLAFAGLQSNFPLFSSARFGWDITANAFFFAFVGVCAVLTQGVLLGRLQSWLGDARLALGGLTLMMVNLGLMALVPQGWMLYPAVGLAALGSGLSIPAITSLISAQAGEREQGKVMGSMQAILSLAMVLAPAQAGLAFTYLGVPAPYWLGSLLAALALLAARRALLAGGATRPGMPELGRLPTPD